ncbi:MAG: KilA-N domain-containing protein [Dolichospermum sp.]
MNIVQVFDYNGQIISRRQNGFINLTQMCQANSKRLDVFMKAQKTKEYIECLERLHQTVVTEIVQGGEPDSQGTWGHPSLAINLARWISPDFAVWCDGHIFNLMSGKVAVHQIPQTYSQALLEAAKLAEENERLEAQNVILERQNEQLSEAVDELFGYSSIIRVAKFNSISENRFKWHRLSAVSVQLGLEIKKVPCPRFGEKNLYSHDVWRVAYPGIPLPETNTLVVRSLK